MAGPRSDDSDPVSVAISRQVKLGQVEAFEAWLDEIKAAAAGFHGYAGMDVIRPADAGTPTYIIILRFASYELYSAWHDSPERAEAVERSLDMTTGPPVFEGSTWPRRDGSRRPPHPPRPHAHPCTR